MSSSVFNGICPCCVETLVINQHGSFMGDIDHFHAPNRNQLEETWPVCTKCNRSFLAKASNRRAYKPAFDNYQFRLRIFFEPAKQLTLFSRMDSQV